MRYLNNVVLTKVHLAGRRTISPSPLSTNVNLISIHHCWAPRIAIGIIFNNAAVVFKSIVDEREHTERALPGATIGLTNWWNERKRKNRISFTFDWSMFNVWNSTCVIAAISTIAIVVIIIVIIVVVTTTAVSTTISLTRDSIVIRGWTHICTFQEARTTKSPIGITPSDPNEIFTGGCVLAVLSAIFPISNLEYKGIQKFTTQVCCSEWMFCGFTLLRRPFCGIGRSSPWYSTFLSTHPTIIQWTKKE